MSELNLSWKGPFEMTIETQDWARGKPGLYAITHDSRLIYIGKAQYGNAVFKEARNRENKWIRCFRRKGILPDSVSDVEAREFVINHCRIYVAIVDDEQLRDLIGKAEEHLMSKLSPTPLCNDLIKNKDGLEQHFLIVNKGSKPPGLPECV